MKRLWILVSMLIMHQGIMGENGMSFDSEKMKSAVAHCELGSLPTPIMYAQNLGDALGLDYLYIKRDDLTGAQLLSGERLFGGNKVRKLEYLLADAIEKKIDTVATFGCIGSNHCVATAAYAKRCGLSCHVFLMPQPPSPIVDRNSALMDYYGAVKHTADDSESRAELFAAWWQENKDAYIIPTGGSVPIGALGFVQAAFELKAQIDAGIMPEPDYIYLPVGSMGTIAGLLLGIKAAGLKTKIIGIAVEPEHKIGCLQTIIKGLWCETHKYLQSLNVGFPECKLDIDDYRLVHDQCGPDYGVETDEGQKAIALFQETQGLRLEGTYSAKAAAGLIQDAYHGTLDGAVILFWYTFDGTL